MTKVLSTKGYEDWEANANKQALEIAEEIIEHYNNGMYSICWTTEQSKTVIQYILMKVWHICSCSGIFILDDVKKIKDKCKITIDLAEQDTEYVD